jgi:hypothetical protein
VPAPERGIVTLESEAVDVIVIFPLAVPDVVGVNTALKFVLWPALSVIGVAIPLKANPGPLIAT